MGQTYQTFTGFGALIGAIVSNAYAKKTERSDYQTQLSLCFIIPTSKLTQFQNMEYARSYWRADGIFSPLYCFFLHA